MTALWVALSTVREAARGRVVRGFAALAAALLVGLALLPSIAPAEKAVMLARLLVGAAGIVATVSLAFVGSSAISGEIERRRIALVLAKPISRASYVAGRALGIALLAPILLGVLYGLAVLVFEVTAGRGLPESLALTHPEREVAGQVSRAPAAAGSGSSIEWRFDRDALAANPSKLRLRVGAEDTRISRVPIALELSNDAGARETRLFLAGTGIVRDLELSELLASGTELWVRATPREGNTALRADPESAVLTVRAGASFASNFALAFLSLACGAALLGVIAVAASAALSGRLALLLALALLVAGSLVTSIRAFGRIVSEGTSLAAIGGAPVEAPAPGPLRVALGRSIENMAALVPDLHRFDLSTTLVAGHQIPWTLLARNGAYALLYAAVCCALACLAFSRREVVR